jgi:hypothetical protein
MTEEAEALAAQVDTLVLAVRSAHLNPEKRDTAVRLLRAARQSVLVCLRSPHDAAALPGADSVLCTCGDSPPSLAAAVAALMGDYVPEGTLPVALEMT